jgi:hypothetical protein
MQEASSMNATCAGQEKSDKQGDANTDKQDMQASHATEKNGHSSHLDV